MKNQGDDYASNTAYQKQSYNTPPSPTTSIDSTFKKENENIIDEGSNTNNNKQSFLNKIFMKSQKTLLTFIYCITFWNFGICVAIFGPTLLDLACQTSR